MSEAEVLCVQTQRVNTVGRIWENTKPLQQQHPFSAYIVLVPALGLSGFEEH